MAEDGPQGIRDWMRSIEGNQERIERTFLSSVDDIKDTVRSQLSDLKTEVIADLKRRIEDGYRTLGEFDKRLREVENGLLALNTGRKIIGGLSHFIVGLISAIAAYFGAKHL